MKKLFLKTLFLLIVLLICLYFIVTNSFVIKSVILPIISISTDTKVTVTAIEISPIRGLYSFDNMVMTQRNKFKANIAHFDTWLNSFDLLRHKLTIHNLKITNLNATYSLQHKDSQKSSTSEIKNLNANIPYLETNGKGVLNFSSGLATTSGKNTVSGSIQGNINATIDKSGTPKDFDLNAILKLGQNTTPIICKFNSTQNYGKKPFVFFLNINNLPLQPFFQAFVEGTYQETNGYVKNLNINANGPDSQDENILQTLSGNLTLSTKDIYIPSDLFKNPLTQVMLIPLEVISKFDNSASFKLFSNNSNNIKSATSEILAGNKLLEFKTGNVKITMKNGDANISNFEFDGTTRSAVQKITITGTINKNQQINLNTVTKISGLIIPLRLTGTLTNPKPEAIELIRGIINQNINSIGTIIDAATKDTKINKTTKSIINTIDNITKENNKSSNSTETSVGNLLEAIKKITD